MDRERLEEKRNDSWGKLKVWRKIIVVLFRVTILRMKNLTSTVAQSFLLVNLCYDMFRP
jgi:hypothetical protein